MKWLLRRILVYSLTTALVIMVFCMGCKARPAPPRHATPRPAPPRAAPPRAAPPRAAPPRPGPSTVQRRSPRTPAPPRSPALCRSTRSAPPARATSARAWRPRAASGGVLSGGDSLRWAQRRSGDRPTRVRNGARGFRRDLALAVGRRGRWRGGCCCRWLIGTFGEHTRPDRRTQAPLARPPAAASARAARVLAWGWVALRARARARVLRCACVRPAGRTRACVRPTSCQRRTGDERRTGD
jgi:hypothetical protein